LSGSVSATAALPSAPVLTSGENAASGFDVGADRDRAGVAGLVALRRAVDCLLALHRLGRGAARAAAAARGMASAASAVAASAR
jgi:hypothetical protein